MATERLAYLNPEMLRLPNGEYANKQTLLEAAYLAHDPQLPVPAIYSPEEARALVLEGLERRQHDPYFWETGDHFLPYRRGYFKQSMDLWAVDLLPTTYASQTQDLDDHELPDWLRSGLDRYLQTNFAISLASVDYAVFFQEHLPDAAYLTTLTLGDTIFCSFKTEQDDRGGLHRTFTQGETVNDGYFSQVLAMTERAQALYDEILGNHYEYKFDFLISHGKHYFIQARVVTIKQSFENILAQYEQISQYQKQGMPTLTLEAGNLAKLNTLVPEGPYLLALQNTQHLDLPSTFELLDLDLRQMTGLILPLDLRGGLLEHHGYRLIAYAFYWGLPIKFTP